MNLSDLLTVRDELPKTMFGKFARKNWVS